MSTVAAPPRECPILFSGEMVRAILAGTKTQTRRVVKGTALDWLGDGFSPSFVALGGNGLSPYGYAGDRLWVRETWALVPRTAYARSEGVRQVLRPDDAHDAAVFAAGWGLSKPGRWRPSIHMPRWASRITLEITGVRVERLQTISRADALAEGVPDYLYGCYFDGYLDMPAAVANYRRLWDSLNAARGYGWDANPWVWVIAFRRVEG